MERDRAREEVDKVLARQAEKGIKRNEICRSLFSFGFSERQVGLVLGINPKSASAAKMKIHKGQRTKKEIKNYLVLDLIHRQIFIRNLKLPAGQPAHGRQDIDLTEASPSHTR